MIHRSEDIGAVAAGTIARWQAEGLEIIQARQASLQEGLDAGPHEEQLRRAHAVAVRFHLHGKQHTQGQP